MPDVIRKGFEAVFPRFVGDDFLFGSGQAKTEKGCFRFLFLGFNECRKIHDGSADVLQKEVLMDSGGWAIEVNNLFPVLIRPIAEVIWVFFVLMGNVEGGWFHG